MITEINQEKKFTSLVLITQIYHDVRSTESKNGGGGTILSLTIIILHIPLKHAS